MPEKMPALNDSQLSSETEQFYEALRGAGYIGDIERSYASRLVVATDNSIYQQLPQAVLFPRTRHDVACLSRVAKKFPDIRFSARGGGTGTNGQSLTSWLVVDFSRHLRGVLELNLEEQWVRVETGLVKDALNDLLRPHGYFFAPDTSTSNRATIGGMIATDASGQGSIVYGKTSDHVLSLVCYTANGERLDTQPLSIAEAEVRANGATWEASVYRKVLSCCTAFREEIETRFPPLNRYLTGYDLKHVVDWENDRVDLARIISGSEGTLGFVTEATLKITPLPNFKALINVKYLDFQAALEHAPVLVNANATSVETIDSNVLDLARKDIVWHEVKDLLTDVPPHQMNGINMVEFTGHSEEEVEQKIGSLVQRLELDINQSIGVIGYQISRDAESIQRVYKMRKKAVGLLAAKEGAEKPVAFVEDTAVPPEKLADYIREFRQLLDSCGLQYGMFGHVDAGVLHVRPALDLTDENQEYLIRALSDAVVDLTSRYGGLMWGEHGKGYRSEYGPSFFGDELFGQLRQIKAVFDPDNRLNPGKICTPAGSNESLVSVDSTMKGQFDRQIPEALRENWSPVLSCNGNGLCFNYKPDTPMCPSYRATGDRVQSPKGRAALLREWLRLRANYSAKQINNFENEVFRSLDSCLSCKACSVQCPVHVDIPSHKSLFLADYYKRNRRPLKDRLIQRSEGILSRLSRWPRLSNALTHNSLSRQLASSFVGYQDIPRFSVPAANARIKRLGMRRIQEFETDTALKSINPDAFVLIVDDAYSSSFNAQLLEDAVTLIRLLGREPILIDHVEIGKGAHVKGFIESFTRSALATAKELQRIHATLGIDMIGLDAATTLCFRDEYFQVLSAEQRGDFNVALLSEWLTKEPINTKELADSLQAGGFESEGLVLLPHCTEQTAMPEVGQQWTDIFRRFGLQLSTVPVGCCGMAGTFGHESSNLKLSKSVYDLHWRSHIANSDNKVVLATGFSCRCQVERESGQQALHPVSYLVSLLQTT